MALELYVRPGIREYLEDLEEVEASDFTFPTECNRLDDINYLKELMAPYLHLQQYYNTEEKYPPILKGEEFRVTHKVAKGGQGSVVLAKFVNDEDEAKYVLKIQHSRNEGKDRDLLFEYMLQEEAHSLLKGSCTVPEPIGFIRQHAEPPYGYIMVARFVPLYPGASNSVILKTAALKHKETPLLSIKDWRDIFLSLITAFETLQAHDIYHNDVKDNNIILRFYENNIEPVIIDFGLATRNYSHKAFTNPDGSETYFRKRSKEVREKDRPYLCPVLFEQRDPIATSDLYGVSYLLWAFGHHLNLPIVYAAMAEYRAIEPTRRPGFQSFFQQVNNAFQWELQKGTEAVEEDTTEETDEVKHLWTKTEGKLTTVSFSYVCVCVCLCFLYRR